MVNPSTHTTGNDPIEGVDPGGTRPTKPGNPDKSGPAKPENVSKEQTVVSGNQNQPANERAR
ncbi:hypothetical protein [Acidisphaera sp. L21]|uniref:hypothetical protein n=1 Tax=Acidisphaera sp. L21 TaxID=1641851 RepID=UPI00131A78D6|nr:hypothetical protein [Acidisphaera sp. L21]